MVDRSEARTDDLAAPSQAAETAAKARAKAELRAWVAQAHPDRGGDPDVFVAQLRVLRQRVGEASAVRPKPAVVYAKRSGGGPVAALRRWRNRRNAPPRVR